MKQPLDDIRDEIRRVVAVLTDAANALSEHVAAVVDQMPDHDPEPDHDQDTDHHDHNPVQGDQLVTMDGQRLNINEPTCRTIKSGFFDDPNTWDKAPRDGDSVRIDHSVTVFDETTPRLNQIQVGPEGVLRAQARAKIHTRTLIGYPGSLISYVGEGIEHVVINGEILESDVDAMEGGILTWGRIVMTGTTYAPYVKSLAGLEAGDVVVPESLPEGWQPDEPVFVTTTRQPFGRFAKRRRHNECNGEEARIGQSVREDHPENDGVVPRLALLRRPIVIRSENPGTEDDPNPRGHFMVTGEGWASLHGVKIQDFGRTLIKPHIGTRDSNGRKVNPAGRYSLHFHHARGVMSSHTTSHVSNCLVVDGQRWGIVLHGTSYANISENVIIRCQGAGIVGEDGNEVHNTIWKNLICDITGSVDRNRGGVNVDKRDKQEPKKGRDWGGNGDGIALRYPGSWTIVGNICHGGEGAGLNVNGRFPKVAESFPTSPGDMGSLITHVQHRGRLRATGEVLPMGFKECRDNEYAGFSQGIWLTGSEQCLGDGVPAVSTRLEIGPEMIRNCQVGVIAFQQQGTTLIGIDVAGDPEIVRRDFGQRVNHPARGGLGGVDENISSTTPCAFVFRQGTYTVGSIEMIDCKVRGMAVGVEVPRGPKGDGFKKAFGNIPADMFKAHGVDIEAYIPVVISRGRPQTEISGRLQPNATLKPTQFRLWGTVEDETPSQSVYFTSADMDGEGIGVITISQEP